MFCDICAFLGCDAPDRFKCKDGTCVPSSVRCDGHYNCPTKDDEDNCDDHKANYKSPQCAEDEFKCNDNGSCIPFELFCDKTNHCLDGSDETIGCELLKNQCAGFTCKNGHCLTDKSWVCDR